MNKFKVVKQAMEIYLLGIEIESKRQKLKDYVEQNGISSPLAYEQAQEIEKLSSKFAELESRHIANIEKYMQKK